MLSTHCAWPVQELLVLLAVDAASPIDAADLDLGRSALIGPPPRSPSTMFW